MSNKTIAKFSIFVIFNALIFTTFSACSSFSAREIKPAAPSSYDPPKITGKIRSDDIKESSGVAASRCQQDVLWTHNDSGNEPDVFAFNPKGDDLGRWRVAGTKNYDWEDMDGFKDPSGKCFLYIGDIGDNQNRRDEHFVYRVAEPRVIDSSSNSGKDRQESEIAESLRFRYPDGDHNAETMLVQPQTGDIYILTKSIVGPAVIYRVKPAFGSENAVTAEKVAEIAVPAVPNGLLTGGAISPDGKRVILCDYTSAYELVLPDNAANFDEIWKQKPETIATGERRQGEAIGYSADGMSIFATSEGKHSPIIELDRRK